jgi:hypothetical protein
MGIDVCLAGRTLALVVRDMGGGRHIGKAEQFLCTAEVAAWTVRKGQKGGWRKSTRLRIGAHNATTLVAWQSCRRRSS